MKQYDLADEPDVFKRVTVRLIEEAERPRFDSLLEQKHLSRAAGAGTAAEPGLARARSRK
jgi:hypothetical protein